MIEPTLDVAELWMTNKPTWTFVISPYDQSRFIFTVVYGRIVLAYEGKSFTHNVLSSELLYLFIFLPIGHRVREILHICWTFRIWTEELLSEQKGYFSKLWFLHTLDRSMILPTAIEVIWCPSGTCLKCCILNNLTHRVSVCSKVCMHLLPLFGMPV